MSLLNPRKIVEAGIVTGLNSDKQIQPAAIEFTADRVFEVVGDTWLLSEDAKGHRETRELQPVNGFWVLEPSKVYDIMSNLYVEMPEGMAALVNIRSTLNRAGLRLTTGIWDPGFCGNFGAILHTPAGCRFSLGAGTRVAQVMFFSCDSEGVYAGGYNTKKGDHWQGKAITGRMSCDSPNSSNTPKNL